MVKHLCWNYYGIAFSSFRFRGTHGGGPDGKLPVTGVLRLLRKRQLLRLLRRKAVLLKS
jgi:hypothetical protein